VSSIIQQPWRLYAVTEPLDEFAPVLALTLLRRRAGQYEILTGVRTAAANRTHPGVVSVPTRRVPEAVAFDWLIELAEQPPGAFRPSRNLPIEVENLLARKLGMADPLELGQLNLRYHDLAAWQGTSVIGENADGVVTERLTMFNACVEISDGAEFVPARTASYDPLVWAPLNNFLEMVAKREVAALDMGLDEILYCVYGLCLETTARLLQETKGDLLVQPAH
jgi:hypothetical protein